MIKTDNNKICLHLFICGWVGVSGGIFWVDGGEWKFFMGGCGWDGGIFWVGGDGLTFFMGGLGLVWVDGGVLGWVEVGGHFLWVGGGGMEVYFGWVGIC